ncbi:MAG: FIST N-terminal domain-containing protein [Pseudomonadota bacterium]
MNTCTETVQNGIARFHCGVTTLSANDSDDATFWAQMGAVAGDQDLAFVTLFFSCTSFNAERIRSRMEAACPNVKYAACSTAGEITQHGMTEGGLVALLFPSETFRMDALALSDIKNCGMDEIVDNVKAARRAFVAQKAASPWKGESGDGKDANNDLFALCLIDGMSFAEEAVTAGLYWALDDIPLIGGSAGDDLRLSDTVLMLNGEVFTESAILILAETKVPFSVFKTDNFIPTDDKLVVTHADPDQRLVYEFNAAPAAQEYARAIGIDPENLSPLSFASYPLVVRTNGEYYCRSIQKANEDGSLSFFCAIDNGIVMTIAEQRGMSRTTRQAFDEVRSDLGAIDFVLGFDCILRRIDARNRQVTQKIAALYAENNVIGFNTYGEQYISMHLNQTFTGIAFGRVRGHVSS